MENRYEHAILYVSTAYPPGAASVRRLGGERSAPCTTAALKYLQPRTLSLDDPYVLELHDSAQVVMELLVLPGPLAGTRAQRLEGGLLDLPPAQHV